MSSQKRKRVTVKLKCPNPLFEQWLQEWKDESTTKESKMQYTFNTALNSLRQYPLPLESGKQCKILKGFGDKLCKMLDQKIKEYKSIHSSTSSFSTNLNSSSTSAETTNLSPIKPNRNLDSSSSNKLYVPQYGSGGFAILVTLYRESLKAEYPGFLVKNEIIKLGRDLVNSSFTKAEPGCRYTAWSSMKTLISKKLVSKTSSRPPKFSLTTEGHLLGKKLHDNSDLNGKADNATNKKNNAEDNDIVMLTDDEELDLCIPQTAQNTCKEISKSIKKPSLQSYASSSSVASSTNSVNLLEEIIMLPFNFDVILYVDTQETTGASKKTEDEILYLLMKSGVKYEVKNLKVGDFTWICRDKETNNELVLPYIIERKRMDDFAKSIKDKRYYEQKFRLKKSGIENLIYLVESHGRNQHVGLPLESLQQAETNTAIQEKFFLKYTHNIKETVEYLVNISNFLIELFQEKTIRSCLKENIKPIDINENTISLITFKEFNESSIKNKKMKITDLFVRMLIQIKGMSVERALAITQKYPTPALLKLEYDSNKSEAECVKLLSNLKYGTSRKNLGTPLSLTVYQAFSNNNY